MITPTTSNRLSSRIKTDTFLTGKLLNVLTALGFLEKKDGKYSNTPFSNAYLVEGGDLYQGNVYTYMDKIMRKGFLRLPEAIETGEILAEDHEFDKESLEIHSQVVKAGAVRQMTDFVRTLPGFLEARTLLDLGGGHGMFGMAFASVNTQLFGLPQYAEG